VLDEAAMILPSAVSSIALSMPETSCTTRDSMVRALNSPCPASAAEVLCAVTDNPASASSSAARPRLSPESSAASIFTSNHDSIECETKRTDTMKMTRPGRMPMMANSSTSRAISLEPNLPAR
jgi:hypothetical protein